MNKLDRREIERLNRYLRNIYTDIREDDLSQAKEKIEQLSESIEQLIEQREQENADPD